MTRPQLAQAAAAYSPVVAIAGSLSTAHVHRDAFQEVDQQALFRPITKKTWTATGADRVPEMFREAFRTRGPSNYAHGKQVDLA